jgi:hypothetical protein
MNKRLLVAWLVVFVAWMAGSFVVHGVLLGADYARLPNLFRQPPQAQQYFPLMILAHVFLSGAFVWIYARGTEPRPWLGQGIRYGVAVALLTSVPMYLIYYVVHPMPLDTVLKQIVLEGLLVVVLGAVAAFVFRANPG